MSFPFNENIHQYFYSKYLQIIYNLCLSEISLSSVMECGNKFIQYNRNDLLWYQMKRLILSTWIYRKDHLIIGYYRHTYERTSTISDKILQITTSSFVVFVNNKWVWILHQEIQPHEWKRYSFWNVRTIRIFTLTSVQKSRFMLEWK